MAWIPEVSFRSLRQMTVSAYLARGSIVRRTLADPGLLRPRPNAAKEKLQSERPHSSGSKLSHRLAMKRNLGLGVYVERSLNPAPRTVERKYIINWIGILVR